MFDLILLPFAVIFAFVWLVEKTFDITFTGKKGKEESSWKGIKCLECGADVPPKSTYCPSCGEPLW